MMAVEGAGEAMLHQPGAAIGAVEPVAAGAAKRERRIAPAVEEEQHLLAGRERLGEGLLQSRRQPGPPRRRSLAQVDRLDRRQSRAAVTIGQPPALVAAALDIDGGLQRGGGGNQDAGAALEARAYHGHVAGVIDHAVLLLEGGVVLLIDDDQAEAAEGEPQRGACADHHLRPALGHRPPGLAPPPRADLGMPDRRVRAEA